MKAFSLKRKDRIMGYFKKQTALRISAVLFIAPLCYAGLSQYLDLLDGDMIFSKLSTIGLSLIIILIPYFFVILSDTIGWKYSFGHIKSQLSAAKLFLLRVATESLQTSLPGGAVYAEVVRPVLIKKYFRFEYSVSISANIITKVNILIAQLLFLVLGFCILTLSFNAKLFFLLFPDYVFYPAIGALFIISAFTVYLLYRRNLLINLLVFFERLNFKFTKGICDKIRNNVYEINQALNLFSKGQKKDLGITIFFFLLTWFLMSFESFIILTILGVDVNILQMIVVESLISIIRMIFFFIPGAVGAQDIGIVILFNLSGISDPQTNAVLFILFKRIKEFFWIIAGYTTLLLLGISPSKLIKNKSVDLRPASENL
jgi:uncharacterized protein (TIRG00374 family)